MTCSQPIRTARFGIYATLCLLLICSSAHGHTTPPGGKPPRRKKLTQQQRKQAEQQREKIYASQRPTYKLSIKALESGIPSWRNSSTPQKKLQAELAKWKQDLARKRKDLDKRVADASRQMQKERKKHEQNTAQTELTKWKQEQARKRKGLDKKKADFNKQLQRERTAHRHAIFQTARNKYRARFDPVYKNMSGKRIIGIQSAEAHKRFSWRVADHKGIKAVEQPLNRLGPSTYARMKSLLLAVRKGIDNRKKSD